MSLENPLEKRIPTQEEISEIGKLSTSIPEKIKNIDSHLHNLETVLNKTTNKNEYDRLETMFNQLEGMKKSIMEISSKATDVVQNPELVPTLTGDAEMDEIFRAQLAPENTTSIEPANIELASDESAIVAIPPVVEEVKTPEPVVVSPVSNAQAQTAPTITPGPTTTPEQPPQAPQTPQQPTLESQAQMIAQKIKNGDSLNQEESDFRKNNWGILEAAMMKNVEQVKPVAGTTAAQALEKNSTPVENISRNLQQSREEYVAAFLVARKNPAANKDQLLALKATYDENTKKGIDEIWEQTKSKKFLIDSLRDEHRALEKEILERDTAETKARIEKSLKKFGFITGSAFLYSLLLTGKIINDGVELIKKGINKITSGNGKGLELLKKHYDAMKASAKAPDPKARFMDQFINPLHKVWGGETGKRSFELGTKEQEMAAKKEAEAAKKAAALEKKKVDNGAKEKTPEELEKSQMKDFLKKSFESGFEGKQMTTKEEKDTLRAWNKIKDKPVHLFMNPEKVTYKNNAGEEVTKKVSDYSKAEQGLYKKIKDAYADRQASTPMGDGMTLEQFIKESIKNGPLK